MSSYAIGGRVLDVYDDPGLGLLAASPFMEKVSYLPLGDPAVLPTLEDRQFGVVFITKKGEAIRKYPLHDLTNTVLSNIYFELSSEQLPPEAKVAAATQIKGASASFGVKPLPAVEKYAAEESVEGRHYVHLAKVQQSIARPVELLEQLKDAYADNRDKYDREDRRELAAEMSKFGMELPSDLKPFAMVDPMVDNEAFFSQCAMRKSLLQGVPEAGHLLDEFVEKHAAFDHDETVRLLETFDRQFGVDAHWDRGYEPNLILVEKVAYHLIPLKNNGELSVSEEELKRWVGSNGELLNKMFGKELAQKITADPSQVWCLPQASKEFLAARMEHGRDATPAEAK